MELLGPYKGKGTFRLICGQGEEAIVLCRLIPNTYFPEIVMPVPKMSRLR